MVAVGTLSPGAEIFGGGWVAVELGPLQLHLLPPVTGRRPRDRAYDDGIYGGAGHKQYIILPSCPRFFVFWLLLPGYSVP